MRKIAHLSTFRNSVWILLYILRYPSEIDPLKSDKELESFLNNIIESFKDNKLISSNFGYFNNYRSLDFNIKNSNLNIFQQGKIILVNKTIYLLIVYFEEGKCSSENYNYFINSFEIVK